MQPVDIWSIPVINAQIEVAKMINPNQLRSRPVSLLERRSSEETLLPTRPASIGSSTAGLDTHSSDAIDSLDVNLEENIETLASPPPQQEIDFSMVPQRSVDTRQNRPYSSSVGWNSSTTLRRSNSTGSMSSLSLEDKGLKGTWPRQMQSRTEIIPDSRLLGKLNKEGGDTWGIRIRYLLVVCRFLRS